MKAAALHELERVEWRVLGALRPVDGVTGMPLGRDGPALRIAGEGARIVRNRSGLYVIREWAALAAHGASFAQPPAAPAPGARTLELAVDDPSGRWLPRLVRVGLPRGPDPAAAAEDSLFSPVALPLYPAPAAELGTNWCALRLSVSDAADGAALGGALLRVVAGGAVLARGLSDWRGEALVPVAGVPVTTWSEDEDAVVVSTLAAVVEAVFDPARGSRTARAAVAAGRAPARPPRVDPDDLERRRASLPGATADVNLAARGALHLNLDLDLS